MTPTDIVEICHMCGMPITDGDTHYEHEDDCTGPETGCDCDLPAHSWCCETCAHDGHEGWPNEATAAINIVVRDDLVAWDTILKTLQIFRDLGGTAKARANRLKRVWRPFTARTGIAGKVADALKATDARESQIHWGALLDDWEQAMDDVAERAAEQAADRRDSPKEPPAPLQPKVQKLAEQTTFASKAPRNLLLSRVLGMMLIGVDKATPGADKSMAITLPEGTVSEMIHGEGFDANGLPFVD